MNVDNIFFSCPIEKLRECGAFLTSAGRLIGKDLVELESVKLSSSVPLDGAHSNIADVLACHNVSSVYR